MTILQMKDIMDIAIKERKYIYALEHKQLYIVPEPLTKNRTCQSYRWKQYAVCADPEPLEAIKREQERPEEWRIVPLAASTIAE
jgi:hypothetical protein